MTKRDQIWRRQELIRRLRVELKCNRKTAIARLLDALIASRWGKPTYDAS